LKKIVLEKEKYILDYFPSNTFWNVKPKELDIEDHSQCIIEKAIPVISHQIEILYLTSLTFFRIDL